MVRVRYGPLSLASWLGIWEEEGIVSASAMHLRAIGLDIERREFGFLLPSCDVTSLSVGHCTAVVVSRGEDILETFETCVWHYGDFDAAAGPLLAGLDAGFEVAFQPDPAHDVRLLWPFWRLPNVRVMARQRPSKAWDAALRAVSAVLGREPSPRFDDAP